MQSRIMKNKGKNAKKRLIFAAFCAILFYIFIFWRETKRKLQGILGLDAKVELVSPNTLQRFEGKAKRIKDLRNKENGK